MLFKTTTKLTEYAELAGTVNFTNIKPTLRMVEQQHIIPVVGQPLYDVINDAYTAATDENTLSATQKALLDLLRQVIGPLVCYYYLPKAEVKLSDSGAQRLETNTNKTAFQNQVLNFREQNLREAEMATELLYQFLEANKADYPEWQSSTAFAKYRSLFIKSGTEFNELCNTASPCRNYMAMRTMMVDVEQTTIQSALGTDLFVILKTKDLLTTDTFTTAENLLMSLVKKAVAYLTIARAIPFLNVRMDANGLSVVTNSRTQNDEKATRTQASDNALNTYQRAAYESGQVYINLIGKWIIDNTVVVVVPDVIVEDVMVHDRVTPNNNFNPQSGSFGMF